MRLVSDRLIGAGFASTPRPDVARWKRRKLLMNLGNAVQAPARSRRRREAPAGARHAEGEACFAAAGMDARPGRGRCQPGGRMQVEQVAGIERGGGSSWQSLARGTGSIEADYLNGEVCLLGRLHGVPTPVNDLLRRRANARCRSEPGTWLTTEENCWPSCRRVG